MPISQLNDVDAYKAPSRKPWLVLLVVLAIGGTVLYLLRGSGEKASPSVDSEIAVAEARQQPEGKSREGSQGATPDVDLLLKDTGRLVSEGALLDARARYLDLLESTTDPALRTQVENRLGKINIDLVMTPRRMPEKEEYLVKRGDSVDRIASRFGTTVELTKINNALANPNLIKAGDRFRIFTGKFALHASKSRNDLLVTMNGAFFKRYPVGMGKYGKTPAGTFVIRDKIKDPPWWRPDGREIPFGDPENILGTRWMSIRATGETEDARGYGIHGTWNEESIGKSSSAGCIRMKNSDVEELFALVPIGTPVTIEE